MFSEVATNEFLEIDSAGVVRIKSQLDYERENTIQYMVNICNNIFIYKYRIYIVTLYSVQENKYLFQAGSCQILLFVELLLY